MATKKKTNDEAQNVETEVKAEVENVTVEANETEKPKKITGKKICVL